MVRYRLRRARSSITMAAQLPASLTHLHPAVNFWPAGVLAGPLKLSAQMLITLGRQNRVAREYAGEYAGWLLKHNPLHNSYNPSPHYPSYNRHRRERACERLQLTTFYLDLIEDAVNAYVQCGNTLDSLIPEWH